MRFGSIRPRPLTNENAVRGPGPREIALGGGWRRTLVPTCRLNARGHGVNWGDIEVPLQTESRFGDMKDGRRAQDAFPLWFVTTVPGAIVKPSGGPFLRERSRAIGTHCLSGFSEKRRTLGA